MTRLFYILIFALFVSNFSIAQSDQQREKELENYKKEMQERQNEAISEFVAALNTDDFVKEIVKQKLHTYAQRKQDLFKQGLREVKFNEQVDHLNKTHFADLETFASAEVMAKIQDFITMTQTERKKREKEKRKKRKNKN